MEATKINDAFAGACQVTEELVSVAASLENLADNASAGQLDTGVVTGLARTIRKKGDEVWDTLSESILPLLAEKD